MRQGRPSQTAMLVAYWRMLADLGITSVPDFHDRFAARLLTGRIWERVLEWTRRKLADPRWTGREKLQPWVDMIVLRVAFIDAAIRDAANPQVVILGAGLDTRAWRLPSLAQARVFEVDHPSTQEYKRAQSRALPPAIATPTFVSLDFERDDLALALERAGHDAGTPTTWVWEGVIMYLGDAALETTLAAIRKRSAPKSTLVAHYHEPDPSGRSSWVRRASLGILGEPQIGLRTRVTLRAELERAGFTLLEDAGPSEQASKVGGSPPTLPRAQVSRIAIATT